MGGALTDTAPDLATTRDAPERAEVAAQVLARVEEEGIETIRIMLADQHGITRGKTVTARALRSALESGVGVPSTLLLKDTSHATVFPVWQGDAGFGRGVMTGAADILMLPDPATFRVLPWAGRCGWMLSDLFLTDGRPVPVSTRAVLKGALERLGAQGMGFVAGLEVEFTILEMRDDRRGLDNAKFQEDPPETALLGHGYQLLTETRTDRLDPILTRLRRHAEALGMPLRSIETEFGPSQVEFVFDPLSALRAADMMVLFRNMVKQVCAREGLHATFMSRPAFPGAMGSGWHLHQSVVEQDSGANLFTPEAGQQLSPVADGWIAGLLDHAASGCVLSTPTITGYKRYQPFQLAPDRIQWGRDNRGAMLRVLCREGDPAARIENRVGEPAANPYLFIASQVLAGLDGHLRGLHAPAPVEQPYDDKAAMLPRNLGRALDLFSESPFWRAALGGDFVDYLSHIKRAEWNRFLSAVTDWEQREYFAIF